MKVRFIGSVGVIVRNRAEGQRLYLDGLGLPLKSAAGTDFLFSQRLEGSRYFGVWPLSEAAKVCFDRARWPGDRPIPQAFIEFEVDDPGDVAEAASELESKGHVLLHPARTDPWGQTVARLQTVDGLVIGISHVPWMHRNAKRRARRTRAPRR